MAEKDYRAYCRRRLFRERAFEDCEQEIMEVYATNDNRRLNMASVYDYHEEDTVPFPGMGRRCGSLDRVQ